MEEARADIATPHPAAAAAATAQKNVFKRLYAGAKTQSLKTGKPSSKSKGRQVSSKFSGAGAGAKKNETQAQKPGQRVKPATTYQLPKLRSSRVSLSGSNVKRLERVSLSAKNAKNKLRTARYWFTLIDVAEKAENHFVAMELFKLAMHCSAEPVSEVRRARAAYKARYKLGEDSAQKLPSLPEAAVEQQDSEAVNEANGEKTLEDEAKLEAAESKLFDEAGVVKDLYKEEYSQLPGAGNSSGVQEEAPEQAPELPAVEEQAPVEPELIIVPGEDEGIKSKPVGEFRRTPRRACAIRAAQRIEESARKQTRKKASASTPGGSKLQESLEVANMDVNALMKEVVSGITGSSCPELGDSPALKKDEEFLVISESAKEQMSEKNKASNKENVQNADEASLEKKERNKAMPAVSASETRKSARLKATPTKVNKTPFY